MPEEIMEPIKKRGRKPKKWDGEKANTIQAMAQYGMPQKAIAGAVGLSVTTLNKLYREELEAGSTAANMKVAQSLYESCVVERNVAAQIFWMKTRCGWKETQRVETQEVKSAEVQVIRIPDNGRD